MNDSCTAGQERRPSSCYRYVIGVAIAGICLLGIDRHESLAQTVNRVGGNALEIDNSFHDAATRESASRKARSASRPVSGRVARLTGASNINEVYPNGYVPPDGGAAGDDGILIYQNTLGSSLFRPLRGRRVADDLSTILGGSCAVSKVRVRVSGGVSGGSGVFRAEGSLYDGCPAEGGSEIPGTRWRYDDLADNAAITHELVIDYSDRGICSDGSACRVSLQDCTGGACSDGSACSVTFQNCADESVCVGSVCVEDPLDIPPTVWLRIRFDTDEAGIVYGMPAQVGFSEDGIDRPTDFCTGNFGGWPEFPHASFWIAMFARAGCICDTDSDCDDGLFCNGAATCGQGGICDVGDPPCGIGELCNEATNACDCATDEYCGDGEFCNGAEICGPDGTCRSGSPPCAPGEVCDEIADECLCDSDDDCDDEAFCNGEEVCREGGICVPVFESDCNGNGMEDDCDLDVGTSEDCDGNLVPDECQADCNRNGMADVCEIPPFGDGADCDANLVPDECDPDCNANDMPDACESNADCNDNGIQDICDLAAGTSGDCNNNAVPDECELENNDCNANDIFDACESNADCNDNGVQDICDIAAGTSSDCNANGVLDDCDFGSGTSVDCNGNALPDECDLLNNDCNGNGFPDDCDFGELTLSGRTDYDVGFAPQAITSGDFDSDGDIDLAISRGFFQSRGYVHVLLNDGFGSFRTGEEVRVGFWPRSIASGDFNGDGLIDIVTANTDSGNISILLNRGGDWLGFRPPEFIAMDDDAQAVTVGDVDLDGDSDIVVVLGFFFGGSGKAVVLLNGGDADFTHAGEFEVGSTPRSVALFDANNDALPDLVVANQHSDSVTVALNGGFDSNGVWQGYSPPLRIGGVRMPFFVGTADFDRDGYVDVVVTRSGEGTVESADILLNEGNDSLGNWLGLLSPAHLRIGDLSTLALSVADFNKDGWTDLAFVGQIFGQENSGTLRTLVNRGVDEAGNWLEFGTVRSYTVEQYPFAVASIDINADSRQDLVVANRALDFGGSLAGTPSVTTFFQGPRTLDCNASNVPDECELAGNDCDFNGIPDECDPDCQPNGIPDACDFSNGLSADCNDNTVPDECETDCSGDGVPDDCEVDLDGDGLVDNCDACLDSDLDALIAIEQCPTGVPNELLDDGCTMNDVLTECSLGAHSHGELTACVVRHANEWRRRGLLSGKDAGRIVHCAGTSNEPRPSKRIKDDGSRGSR